MHDLPPALQELLKTARIKRFPKGQIIVYMGDTAPEVMIIKKGIVKVHDIDDLGNEKILHIVRPPAVMPFVFFSGGQQTARWFYSSVTDCEVYVLPKEKLAELVQSDAKVGVYLTNWFSREMHELLTRLSSLGKTNARDKLVAALKFLSVCHSRPVSGPWLRVIFPVSHQLLANLVGITRESAAVAMKEMADEKIVRTPKLTVLEINFEKLIA